MASQEIQNKVAGNGHAEVYPNWLPPQKSAQTLEQDI